MTDYALIIAGIVTFLFSGIMVCYYLFKEKGSLLDPIAVSWFGYMLCISVAMYACAYLVSQRPGYSVRMHAILIVFCGTITYTLGLYVGKSRILKKCLPRVAPTLSLPQIIVIFIVCSVLTAVVLPAYILFPVGLISVLQGLVLGAIGTLTLTSLLVLLGYKGHWFLKIFMLVTISVMALLTYRYIFSRRQLVGIFIAVALFFYYSKLMWKPVFLRAAFWIFLVVASSMIILYVGATRGQRFRGTGAASYEFLSKENIQEFLGGLTINYMAFEYTVQQYPGSYPYLHGRGLVPAFLFWIPRSIWPGKPIASGAEITRVWFNESNPTSNIANTPFGELYMNFGWAGILLGFFMVGKIVRAFNQYWLESPNNVVLALSWFIVIPSFVGQWRGDFTSMFVQGLMQVIIFLGMAWLAHKFIAQPSNDYWYEYDIQSPAEENENAWQYYELYH